MGSRDINLAGLRLTPDEWAALEPRLRAELLQLVISGQGWDQDAYDSFELGIGAAETQVAVTGLRA